jgi:hypothetical protein
MRWGTIQYEGLADQVIVFAPLAMMIVRPDFVVNRIRSGIFEHTGPSAGSRNGARLTSASAS